MSRNESVHPIDQIQILKVLEESPERNFFQEVPLWRPLKNKKAASLVSGREDAVPPDFVFSAY